MSQPATSPKPADSSQPETPTPPRTAATQDTTGESGIVHWQCEELLVDATREGEVLHLAFSGRSVALPHAESLVGTRFADAAGNAFTEKGDGAQLMLAGERQRDCTHVDHASPWSDAAARGIAFRAVGSEPGWWVEVGSGERPPLQALLDYGDRRLAVAHARRIEDGYAGTAADGTPVKLQVRRERCQDGMSGEAFEANVRLQVGDHDYRGCGAWLDD